MIRSKTKFSIILSVISIIGFLAILIESFTDYQTGPYVFALLPIFFGIALIVEGKPGNLYRDIIKYKKGLTNDSSVHLSSFLLGSIIIIVGILSFPVEGLNIVTPSIKALRGVTSVLAIGLISVETWFVK